MIGPVEKIASIRSSMSVGWSTSAFESLYRSWTRHSDPSFNEMSMVVAGSRFRRNAIQILE